MKLAALYTIYNGTELLKGSIEQIARYCDEIIICYQNHSNTGNVSRESDNWIKENKEFLRKIGAKILYFYPDLNKNTKQNERDKHNCMLETARKQGCTHFFLSACDHYYDQTEFEKAKMYVSENNIDVSLTYMYTFYKQTNWRLEPIESYCMPFICKIHPDTTICQNPNYPILTDPSVQVAPAKNFHIFSQDEIMLYHFSMIRLNIDSKFDNAAASIRWTKEQIETFKSEYKTAKLGSKISYFQGREIVEMNHRFTNLTKSDQ